MRQVSRYSRRVPTRKISLNQFVALSNTGEARRLIVKRGINPAQNMGDLIKKLDYIVAKDKEEGLKDVLEIHPHKDVILHYFGEKKSSACGCSGADGEQSQCEGGNCKCNGRHSNINGEEEKPKSTSESTLKEYVPVMLVGAFFLVGLCLVVKSN